MISSDTTANRHYLRDGFSATILDSFSTAENGNPRGVTWEGRFAGPSGDKPGNGTFRLFYARASATSGDVVWEIETLSAAEGEDFDAAGIAVPLADTVQATADFIGFVDIATGTVYRRATTCVCVRQDYRRRRPPDALEGPPQRRPPSGRVQSRPVLGGLHHEYQWAA